MSEPPSFRVLSVKDYERLTLDEKLAYLSSAFDAANLSREAPLAAMSSRPEPTDSKPR